MVVGILQFEVLVHGSQSLKDKRRVVKSLKDRLHREHLVSVAEVGGLDSRDASVLGLALVGRDGEHVGKVLDQITTKLREMIDAEVGDVSRQIIQGMGGDGPVVDTREADHSLDAELLARGESSLEGQGGEG